MGMMDGINTASIVIGIILGVGSILVGVFKTMAYVTNNIVAPMQVSIAQLTNVTKDLRSLLEQLRKDTREQDRRITVCEQSCKAAHHRLDTLEERVDNLTT